MSEKRVAVALSGGVDSSVAAILLAEAGYEVIGLHMRLFSRDASASGSVQHSNIRTPEDDGLEQFCSRFGIPLYIINLENEFRQHVIDYFCNEYVNGRTPNPCVVCNKHIKFGLLLNKAVSMGADYLATGHYARIKYFEDSYHLLKGADNNKDQSYVLYKLRQDKMDRILFPLGDKDKNGVTETAKRLSLPAVNRASSQDACFVNGDYRGFISRNIATEPGEIINRRGDILGRHKGIAFYTVGQRHGLGIAHYTPMYVIEIDPKHNKIIVGTEDELYNKELTASNINWTSGQSPSGPLQVMAKIRYRSPEVEATLYPHDDLAVVSLHSPQRAVTPGQAVVFYRDNELIGGGTIEK